MSSTLFEPVSDSVSLLKVPLSTFWTGVYLVRTGDAVFLVDSSTEAERVDTVIVPALKAAGLEPKDLDMLLCTHTHGDHIGGHRRLKELGVPKIAVAAVGEAKLREPLVYNKAIRAVFPEDSAPPASVLDGVEPDIVLEDGQSIGPLTMFNTPGHDSDCVVFFEPKTGTLITGDSIQWHGTDVQGTALVMDLPGYLKSLEIMKALHPSVIVPGHDFNPFSGIAIDTQDKAAHALKTAADILDGYETMIRELLSTGVTDPRDIVRNIIPRLGGTVPKYLFLPLYTVTQLIARINQN